MWAALYQQDPIAAGSAEWPDRCFGPGTWFDEWPADLALRVLALDPSKGASDRFGDYSAIVRLGICPRGDWWVAADLARRPTSRIVDDVLSHAARWKPAALGAETNQFQQLLADELIRTALARGMADLHLVPIENRLPKVVRIRRLGPKLMRGKIHFRRGCPGTALLVEQLRDFPLAAHDDGPDALEMAVRTAETLLGTGVAEAEMEMD